MTKLEKAIRDLRKGETYRAVAERYDLGLSYLHRHAKKHGIGPREHGQPKRPANAEEIIAISRLKRGWTYRDAAAQAGIPLSRLHKFARRAGL